MENRSKSGHFGLKRGKKRANSWFSGQMGAKRGQITGKIAIFEPKI